jgi:hypothetical protein
MAVSSSGSSIATETDADLAIKLLRPKQAEFLRLFTEAMQVRESGFTRFEVKFSKGRVTGISVTHSGEIAP